MQCIQSYSSQEPDELSIEMADVLNLLERTDDGVYWHKSALISPLKLSLKDYYFLVETFYFLVRSLSIFMSSLIPVSSVLPGWMMGERLHDGERGWFPSRVVEEIQSKEVRAQNLREAIRIQQAQEGGGGPQTGARVGLRSGRRPPKVSSFSSHLIDQMGDSSDVKQ